MSSTQPKTPSLAKQASSGTPATTGKQASILGFFSSKTTASHQGRPGASPSSGPHPDSSPCLRESKTSSRLVNSGGGGGGSGISTLCESSMVTPVPSSDAAEPRSDAENVAVDGVGKAREAAPLQSKRPVPPGRGSGIMGSSPSRKAKKPVSYAESSEEDEDEDVVSRPPRRGNRRAAAQKDDDDMYKQDEDASAVLVLDEDIDTDDLVLSEESEAPSKKRKRNQSKGVSAARKRSIKSSPPRHDDDELHNDEMHDEPMEEQRPASTAQQWAYDPDMVDPVKARHVSTTAAYKVAARGKAHTQEPDQRYPWLAKMADMNRNPVGHADYDPSTVYVPPSAWNAFSAFEKQYWEIKQKLWDTVVFFKKGKFYELYENDATIGHQLFDLKMTDRVNMRMVGVPESSLDVWVNQFVAKGYKVARVEQMESALGKEMRERDDATKGKQQQAKSAKKDKIIRRELACILTAGTLVDGSMLQDDSATYCVAIKEMTVDDHPAFGIAFVDAATGHFFVSEFDDDLDLTKFETFVAQTNPRELVVEKSRLSTKALRILKSKTAPTTIWNYLKPGTEFWGPELTRRELECSAYFATHDKEAEAVWPESLQNVSDKDLLMSALGGLIYYLRGLKIEGHLLSQRNFSWYSPIHRNGTLILDGQTLSNLEIFSNTANGGSEGTLFSLLNRCVTPFGKRLFRLWLCHPLCDKAKLEERLDAVQMLMEDDERRDKFTSQMSRMPDLERLISRVHAGACRADDFVKLLDGFGQMEKTMKLLGAFGAGNSLLDRLRRSMPDLGEALEYWDSAFDRQLAREDKMLIPEKGIEPDFDASHDRTVEIKADLEEVLEKTKSELKTKTIKFTDVGKEVYQLEVPKAVKVPKTWQQMSATANVKRYYFPALSELVRQLQEAEETHSQLVKEVALRLFRRFDAKYATWLDAIHVVSQLDCLISLAKSSASLGQPSCRPRFVEEERSVVAFKELRHPCMLNTVDDFIPNDIMLGGASANINLVTGANAAGKSTVLRMACVAVILAQIGHYIPAKQARLTACDRIMSRLGANDNIMAAQSTFLVELSETKKILTEATARSLVILDELGRGTSSYDGVAVAQAVLHHVATHIGCVGFFATHYHSLATEFEKHPEIRAKRMKIAVDGGNRQITFLYKLEDGVAEGSFGMHCAAMCGISDKIIARAEEAAKEWEHTSRLRHSLERARDGCWIPLGVLSDVAAVLKEGEIGAKGLDVLVRAVESL